MQKNIFILYLLTVSFALKGQSASDSLTSASIDSVINNIRIDKTKLILIKTGGLIIDSALFKKASYTLTKKSVKVTYSDNSTVEIDANDFWGLVTDFGQSQRFYKGETYIVWHTKPPYVYREYAAADYKIKYFYSKTLTSEILPLTKENVYEISDAKTIEQLQAYLKTHDIEKSKDGIALDFSSGELPFYDLFSDDDEATPPLLDLFLFHVKMGVWLFCELGKGAAQYGKYHK